jgi:predicted membrane-bound spermidine synthase
MADAGANRYAAEQLQRRYLDRFESVVPIRKDFEVTEEELRMHDVVFVGRPESNFALAAWQDKLGLDADGALFRVGGLTHASETEALAFAATNPLDRRRMVLVLAGNDALETVLITKAFLGQSQYTIFDSGKETASGFQK